MNEVNVTLAHEPRFNGMTSIEFSLFRIANALEDLRDSVTDPNANDAYDVFDQRVQNQMDIVGSFWSDTEEGAKGETVS